MWCCVILLAEMSVSRSTAWPCEARVIQFSAKLHLVEGSISSVIADQLRSNVSEYQHVELKYLHHAGSDVYFLLLIPTQGIQAT